METPLIISTYQWLTSLLAGGEHTASQMMLFLYPVLIHAAYMSSHLVLGFLTCPYMEQEAVERESI